MTSAEPPTPPPPGRLTPAVREPGPEELVMYSAVTWNPHRLHYDRDYVARLGHPAPLVHGALLADWVVQWALARLGPGARLRRLSYRVPSPAYLGGAFEILGEARDPAPLAPGGAAAGRTTVSLDARIHDRSGAPVLAGELDVEVGGTADGHGERP
jgi:acyl dehydratase